MHTEFFEKTAILEEILSYKLATHSLTPKRLSNPKISDVPHATTGLSLLLKNKKLKIKQTEKHDSKTAKWIIYIQGKKLTKNQEK